MKLIEGKIPKQTIFNLDNINVVDYVLTDITNNKLLISEKNNIQIGLLELGEIKETITRYNRSFYIGKYFKGITNDDIKKRFFIPFSNEHMAKIYI